MGFASARLATTYYGDVSLVIESLFDLILEPETRVNCLCICLLASLENLVEVEAFDLVVVVDCHDVLRRQVVAWCAPVGFIQFRHIHGPYTENCLDVAFLPFIKKFSSSGPVCFFDCLDKINERKNLLLNQQPVFFCNYSSSWTLASLLQREQPHHCQSPHIPSKCLHRQAIRVCLF